MGTVLKPTIILLYSNQKERDNNHLGNKLSNITMLCDKFNLLPYKFLNTDDAFDHHILRNLTKFIYLPETDHQIKIYKPDIAVIIENNVLQNAVYISTRIVLSTLIESGVIDLYTYEHENASLSVVDFKQNLFSDSLIYLKNVINKNTSLN